MASRYTNIALETTEQGTEYLAPVLYPEVEIGLDDIYVIASEGDRFDRLSMQFYRTVEYWWVIMAANLGTVNSDSLAITPGLQIRIPESPEDYIVQYQNLNSSKQ